jgi:hypothetical protein
MFDEIRHIYGDDAKTTSAAVSAATTALIKMIKPQDLTEDEQDDVQTYGKSIERVRRLIYFKFRKGYYPYQRTALVYSGPRGYDCTMVAMQIIFGGYPYNFSDESILNDALPDQYIFELFWHFYSKNNQGVETTIEKINSRLLEKFKTYEQVQREYAQHGYHYGYGGGGKKSKKSKKHKLRNKKLKTNKSKKTNQKKQIKKK